MDGKISYGMYYKMISPATLPSGAIIAQVSDDLTMLAKGQLESGTSKTVPMVIKNTSDSEITVEIGVRTGYATDSQGVDDIIYNEGEIPITSFQTSEEAGNDSCTSTMECTEECESRQVNGEWKIFCVCNTGNDGSNIAINGTQLLQQLKAKSNGIKNEVSSVATTDEGIWETLDDYGTTYYFRGAVENNYVKFAGYYWRIIRINGDGSIRMIYDGTVAHANGEISTDRQIGTSAFNENYNDNAYVGYMYGTPGSSTYEETHANINDSTIKTVVDNWYKTNIVDKGYNDKIADVIYCNNRSLYLDDPAYPGHGNGISMTKYNSYFRYSNDYAVTMKCQQLNQDGMSTISATKGNKALTYSVGLITVDEAVLAGALAEKNNHSFYLYTGYVYWGMMAESFDGSYAYVRLINSDGMESFGYANIAYGVRPVISLKPSVELTGTGTMSNPYQVQ